MKSDRSHFLPVAYWEWQILKRERGFQLTLLLLLVLCGFAVWNGVQRQKVWHDTVTQILADEQSDRQFLLAAFEEETDPEKIAGHPLDRNQRGRASTLRLVAKLPTSLAYFGGTTHAVFLPSRLGSFSTGNMERFPNRFLINAHSMRTVLERADLISPYSQVTGPFDLAMLIGIVVPLFVIGLGYDIVSSERELGLFSLSTIQSRQPVVRYGVKMLVRLALPTLVLVLSIPVASWMTRGDFVEESLSWRTAALCLLTILYVACWGSACLVVNTCSGNSTTNAVILLSLWCGFAVLLPSVVSGGATARFPAPTGVELVQREREIQADLAPQGRDLQAAYYEEHPEDRPDDANKDRYGQTRWSIISHHVDRRMADVIGQKYAMNDSRERWLSRWEVFSPVVAWRHLADQLSGVSEDQFVRFQQSAGGFHTAFKAYFLPGMMSRREFARNEVEAMPRFAGQVAGDDVSLSSLAWSGTVLFLWSVGLLAVAAGRLRRLRPV